MADDNEYVILEWIHHLAGFPRYSFATIKHAEELRPQVRWLQQCPSLELAAETASRLNFGSVTRRAESAGGDRP